MAVDVPAEVRESLAAWAREATTQGGAVRVLSPSLLHLTLAFLGERPSREIDLIADLALGCAQPAASLSLAGPVWLPPRRPRALAVEIADPTGALHDLQRSVAQALVAGAGHELEGRRFRPHLTVARRGSGPAGRGGSGDGSGVGGEGGGLPATPDHRFDAQALTLYRSRLSPAGASYEALASVALS